MYNPVTCTPSEHSNKRPIGLSTEVYAFVDMFSRHFADAFTAAFMDGPIDGFNVELSDAVTAVLIAVPMDGFNVEFADAFTAVLMDGPMDGFNVEFAGAATDAFMNVLPVSAIDNAWRRTATAANFPLAHAIAWR